MTPAIPPTRHGTAEELFGAVRSRWPVIVVITALTAFAAWGIGIMQPNRYRASAVAAIVPTPEALPEASDRLRGLQALDQRTIVASVAAFTSMPIVADAAMTPADRGYAVRAVVLPNTNLLRIDVDGGNAARAAEIANRVPALLATRTRAVFGLYTVAGVSPAAAGDLTFPRIDRIVAAGLVIGLILGVLTAWLLTVFGRGVTG
jgi:capsular polysaccharide biosynthesis protein